MVEQKRYQITPQCTNIATLTPTKYLFRFVLDYQFHLFKVFGHVGHISYLVIEIEFSSRLGGRETYVHQARTDLETK